MNTTLSIRTNNKIKLQAQKKLESFGLTLSSAVNMYLTDIAYDRAVPVSDSRFVSNKIMAKWEEEVVEAKKGKGFANIKDLMLDLYK